MGTHTDTVKQDILDQLRNGVLLPGDVIDEVGLRTRHGLSVTPVREAISYLEALGLVERKKRCGARVKDLDFENLIGMVEVHAELEGAVAFQAARRINKKQEIRLKAATEACEQYVKTPESSPSNYYNLNLEFHLTLHDAAGNSSLIEFINLSGNRLLAYVRARHLMRDGNHRSAKEHRVLYDSIIDGNAKAARKNMSEHIMLDNSTVLDVINSMRR